MAGYYSHFLSLFYALPRLLSVCFCCEKVIYVAEVAEVRVLPLSSGFVKGLKNGELNDISIFFINVFLPFQA